MWLHGKFASCAYASMAQRSASLIWRITLSVTAQPQRLLLPLKLLNVWKETQQGKLARRRLPGTSIQSLRFVRVSRVQWPISKLNTAHRGRTQNGGGKSGPPMKTFWATQVANVAGPLSVGSSGLHRPKRALSGPTPMHAHVAKRQAQWLGCRPYCY